MARTRSNGAVASGTSSMAGAATATTTRTATASSSSPSDPTTIAAASRYSLSRSTDKPPQLLVLPKRATHNSRVVTLQNPRYSRPTRYLVCPETGTYEFTQISAPTSTPRSWLIESSSTKLVGQDGEREGLDNAQVFDSHILQDADLYVASPIDPLFLTLPALFATCPPKSDGPRRMFRPVEDYLDTIADDSGHLFGILNWPSTRKLLESRMGAVCDTVPAGDENMFRLSEEKLLAEILSKARRMSEGGLPRSMEDKFVTKPLEAPFIAMRASPCSAADTTQDASPTVSDGTSTPMTESTESQSSAASAEPAETIVSEVSTAATSVASEPAAGTTDEVRAAVTASEEVVQLQRLRVAFEFICSRYVAPACAESLRRSLASPASPADFAPLDDYLAQLARLRQDAVAARALTDYSRKRTLGEDDDERAEKRRRREEEERRKKAGESRGVRELKKVNVTGMKKLSDFFRKK